MDIHQAHVKESMCQQHFEPITSYAQLRQQRRSRLLGPQSLLSVSPNPNTSAQEPILVAIVGVTGSGKSSFIKRVTGRDDILIGEGLCSATSFVQEYTHVINGTTYTLIDTPGFDDTDIDDEDIFEQLADYLDASYRKGQKLTGLMYFHRISSNREKGSDLRNLRMFQKLCGEENFANLLIGMTWWDKESDDIAHARENALRESDMFWGPMIKHGARIARIPFEPKGCAELVQSVVSGGKMTLQIQQEMVLENKSASETGAASEMDSYRQMQAIRDFEDLELLTYESHHQEQCNKLDASLEQYRFQRQESFQLKKSKQVADWEAFLSARNAELELAQQHELLMQNTLREIDHQRLELERSTELLQQERQRSEANEERRLVLTRKASAQRAVNDHARRLAQDLRLVNTYIKQDRMKQKTSATLRDDDWWSRSCAFCDVCKRPGPFLIDVWCCEPCQKAYETRVLAVVDSQNHTELPDMLDSIARNRDISDPFMVCNDCKTSDAALRCCDVKGHEMSLFKGADFPNSYAYTKLKKCRRFSSRPVSVTCSGCSELVDSVYFHCCECDDNFDLCIKCFMSQGKTCRKPKKHPLHALTWHPTKT